MWQLLKRVASFVTNLPLARESVIRLELDLSLFRHTGSEKSVNLSLDRSAAGSLG